MCGILAVVYRERNSTLAQKLIDELTELLSRRGRDHFVQSHFKPLPGAGNVDWTIGVVGCVLQMRGPLTPQPILNEDGDWLLWNGEVYDSSLFKIGDSDNDALLLSKSLKDCTDVLQVLSSIHGPWSTIHFQASSSSLWFGRDILGRRSLCWHLPKDDSDLFAVSSVACLSSSYFPMGYWEEVPTRGIFRLPLYEEMMFKPGFIICYPWKYRDTGIAYACSEESSPLVTTHKESSATVPFRLMNASTSPTGQDHTLYSIDCSQKLLEILQEAVLKRVATWKGSENIGILFSGGVDSVVLAALTDRCLGLEKEVDLINVAFDQCSSTDTTDFSVPDRIAAIEALKELNPNRKWNLVLVDVCKDELSKLREEHIHKLVYPLKTVMDDSIGCALWFAARGKGVLHRNGERYESQCKVVLVGMGADEQFAGYARHRTSYQRLGWRGVLDEVSKDINRISSRNLGRDDRCISDHNREARYPYLDERVVDYVNSLPIWIKTDYSQPRGIGEKFLLRRVASMLGCQRTAELPKRAIQFGSRIAKISGTSGNRLSGNDTMTYNDTKHF